MEVQRQHRHYRHGDTDGRQDGSRREEDDAEGWEERTAGRTEPSWFADMSSVSAPNSERLDRDISADVAIVGGGIAGMTTGYLLMRAGKRVVLLDDGNVASGETGRTTAHATCALDDRYYSIERMHGPEGAQLAAESHTAAIDLIESIATREGIECDFTRVDGYLFPDPTCDGQSIKDEFAATRRAGLRTELLEDPPVRSLGPGPCLRFPNQAHFHPLKYMAGLAQAIVRGGGKIFTGTHVQEVMSTGVRTADGHKVSARKVVVATNAPIIDEVSKIYEKQDAYRTYVIAARVDRGAVPDALYWDTGNRESPNIMPPYHYVRLQRLPDYDLLVVGGEDHETGAAEGEDDGGAERRWRNLEEWARDRFPIQEIEYRWSGQVMEPTDSLAFIGRNPNDSRKNVFIATGDSGNGITHGTIAGVILTDLILGKKNRWAKLYDPSRRQRPRKRKGEEQDGNDDGQPPQQQEEEQEELQPGQLRPGQGAVVEGDDGPTAFYRDMEGRLHSYSAVCTHLGCTVVWNDAEKSFDCPCHGSRFSYAGRAINGPTNSDLEPSSGGS
jgi:glycine/D-amino acid oxidase-like deaminating enzyme/nitrite reductase/ring-hydroxylating ferredoxin subunit